MNFATSQGGEEAPALNLAFALDLTWQPVGIRLREEGDEIHVQLVTNPAGASEEAVRSNLVRIQPVNRR